MALALLWHLHQPDYRDPDSGVPVMPWTRLHALRGYRDLLVESAERAPPWTLNIAPGLLQQLLYYAEGGHDAHLRLTTIPADALSASERDAILQTFPCGHPRMRDTPRYRTIEAAIARGERLGVDALRDLQVLSTLVWTGATARRDHPELAELIAKGSGFDEADKEVLLAAQRAILAALPDQLRRVVATEGPTLSTTPLHHPILPLLVDLRHAARAVRQAPAVRLARPDHALAQLEQGRQLLRQIAGVAPVGCWPSEGAVSPEVLPLIAQAGFRWLASDEELLSRSAFTRTAAGPGPWDLGHGLVGLFRDRALSDRVGFDYVRWPTERAVDDLLEHGRGPGVRLVALDGENPWEAWPDAGAAFRAGLMQGLDRCGVSVDAAAARPVVGTVHRLHTGSWIGANLEIWAGSAEDHAAWGLLAEAVDAVGDDPRALEHLLAAEGSDWFWWYGPEFDTPFLADFDRAFRGHLRAAWRAAGRTPPANLEQPVQHARAAVDPPARPLAPELGEPGWFGAGRWMLTQGAMAHADAQVVEYGWDADGGLWLRGPAGLGVVVDGHTERALSEAPLSLGRRDRVQLTIAGQRATLVHVDWVV